MLRTAMMTAIALSLAGTALAQQKADPQLRQQAETIYSKWEKAVNDYNASAFKDLETADAFTIGPYGIETPGMAEKGAERTKSMGVNIKGSVKEVQQIDADTALSYGPYQVTFTNPQGKAEGNWMQVLEKQGSEWKVRAMTYSRQVSQQQPSTASGSSPQPPASGSSTSK
jgi:ketosteroid isomerase-like protein